MSLTWTFYSLAALMRVDPVIEINKRKSKGGFDPSLATVLGSVRLLEFHVRFQDRQLDGQLDIRPARVQRRIESEEEGSASSRGRFATKPCIERRNAVCSPEKAVLALEPHRGNVAVVCGERLLGDGLDLDGTDVGGFGRGCHGLFSGLSLFPSHLLGNTEGESGN